MPVLIKELKEVNPNCIVLLGDNVLKAFTGQSGVSHRRGSVIMTKYGFKVLISYHPAAALYDGFKAYNELVMQMDFKRALKQSKRPDLPTEKRRVTICTGPSMLREWIVRERGPLVVADIEVIRSVPVCIGIGFNEYRSMVVPLFRRVMNIPLTEMRRLDLAKCIRLTAKILAKSGVIGQNLPFDHHKLEQIGYEFGRVHADTALMAQTVDPELPKALEFTTSIHTDIPYYKDEGKDFNPRYDKIENFYNYCGKDIHAEFAVYNVLEQELKDNKLHDFFYNFVMPCYEFYYEDLRQTGFRIDFKERERLRQKYFKMFMDCRAKVKELSGREVNWASPKQVKELFDYLRIPSHRGTGEDIIVDILSKGIRGDPAKEQILITGLKERKVRKTLGTYVNAKVDFDGRLRTIPKQGGTETGRTATGTLSPPERPWTMGMSLHGVTKHGEVGSDIRQFFIPDDGYCFLEIDSAQAEARVVAVLAEDWNLLDNLKDPSFDMHITAAEYAFPGPLDKHKDKDKRQVGKRMRHAGNYDMGAFRLVQLVQADSFSFGKMRIMPLNEAERILIAFHGEAPQIRSVFHKGIKNCLYEDRILRSPLGRSRYFFGQFTEKTFKEAYATLPQSIVTDNTKLAMLHYYPRMKDWRKEYPLTCYLLESHDGVIIQVPIGKERIIANEFKSLMERPIDFRDCSLPRDYNLVIPAEVSVSYTNWKDLKENGFSESCPETDQ